MTTSNGDGGYALTYLTPNRMVDWSGGEAVVRWDQHHRPNFRDWWDVWIAPYDKNMARPFDNFGVDLHGVPSEAIHVELRTNNALCITEIRNHEDVSPSHVFGSDTDCNHWVSLEDVTGVDIGSEQSARQRETIELRISSNKVTLALPDYDYTYDIYEPDTPIPYSQGIVQFGHHSYTPCKESGDSPGTWHWDEVRIEPSVPFSIIKSDTDFLDSDDQVVTFDSPAPANSHLRFAAVGEVEISLDGGPFVAAQKQDFSAPEQEGFAHSYWHPVPEGTQQVAFRLSRGMRGGNDMARDFAIWSTEEQPDADSRLGDTEPEDVPPESDEEVALPPDRATYDADGPSITEEPGDNGDLFRGVVIGLSAGVVLAAGAGGLLMRRRRI
ncbi:MAG: hypothetical protein U5Q44_01530 [Dehalococcoidia bacterium]|nr:hypothetical protein [Dehalococcoidia bacterium]